MCFISTFASHDSKCAPSALHQSAVACQSLTIFCLLCLIDLKETERN